MARDIRIGLIGFGTIGTGVIKLLQRHQGQIRARLGARLVLARVADIDLRRTRGVRVDRKLLTGDAVELLKDPTIDVVMELMGGYEPARRFVLQAIRNGKSVVTANKALLAVHGTEIFAAAERSGVDVGYEASVGGGIPIIAPLKRDLLANDITAISAIINGTTNYILTRMSREGSDFDEALRQAQALGYAEADPASDVDGIDAAYKLAILASLAFRTEIHPKDVYCEGIRRLGARDFRYARELGHDIKLLALAKREGASIQARVHPVLLPEQEPLAKVDGVLNAVQVEGDLVGRVLFQGQGAGSIPTSSAVVADVLDAAWRVAQGGQERPFSRPQGALAVRPISELRTRYYMRMVVTDQPGVLGQITTVLGDNEISIASVIQKEADETAQTAEIVIMTHVALEAAVQKALQEVHDLAVVREIGNFLRVED
jgi:homoserine dehydrogenase